MAEDKVSSAHLILNPAAGGAAGYLGGLTKTARERGIRVRKLAPGEDARIAAIAAVKDGTDVLGVAGGDGSVAAVASVAVERELPLMVVPLGTLNHFARDLGLDLTRPLHALGAFHAGPSGAWTSGGSTSDCSSTMSRSASTPRCWEIRATDKTS